MVDILIAAAVIGGLGAIFGIGLSYASKVFAIQIDEKVALVREVLPGANCGACGYVGCDAYAEAIATGGAEINACTVGGNSVVEKVAVIMGVEASSVNAITARMLCNGRCSISKEKYDYQGMNDCAAAAQLFGGHKACTYGCLGHGNCQRACPYNAIVMVGGIAKIIEDRCQACTKCVAACPKHLIEMVPKDKKYSVVCRSKDKGPVTKSNCEVGCIGCMKCIKVCESKAISMDGPLAKIDYALCTNCGECVKVCPTMAIRKMDY